MAKKKSDNNKGIIGNVEAKNLAVGNNAKAIYNETNSGTSQELQALVEQLKTALADVPEEQKEIAEFVANEADALQTAAEKETPAPMLQIKADGLKKAAEALKSVTPSVLAIATQIATHILRTTT